MHDISVLTYDADTVLGLRFRLTSAIEVIGIVGMSDATDSTMMVMAPDPEMELYYDLPSSVMLTEEELVTERAIHGLEEGSWFSSRVQKVLFHQHKRSSGNLELSAPVALAALQERLQAPLAYLGERSTIVIGEHQVAMFQKDEHVEIANGSYLCGSALTPALMQEYDGAAKRLTFEAVGIQVVEETAKHLHGLDHLFALAIGGAIFSSPSVNTVIS